jgi:uncharacterized protein YjbI with pentapeptide repeats
MLFQREKQQVSAAEILEAIAGNSEINLFRCSISGELDLSKLILADQKLPSDRNPAGHISPENAAITLTEPIVFRECIFEENAFFAPPWASPHDLKVIFKNNVVFNSSVFKNQANFSSAVFEAEAAFDGCSFESVAAFRSAEFCANAMFRTATFKGYCLLTDAVFHSEARFSNTFFAKGANFTKVKFNDRTDFSGVYAGSRAVPVHDSVHFKRKTYGDDESFWRFIKQVAQEAGYYQLAGEAFYNERCAHLWSKLRGPDYHSIPKHKKILRLFCGIRLVPEMILGKYLFGYGERPIRVLTTGAMIILTCAFFYFVAGRLLYLGKPFTHSFIDSLYFSTITFTTLGFGDLYPADHFTRYIAMVEALSGVCLMSLFVVSLAKRYSRG